MGKEAQKKIEEILKKLYWQGRRHCGIPITDISVQPEVGQILELLNYRKLPKEKPPLLSDVEIRSKVKGMPSKLFLFYESSYEESSIDWNEFIAQAQREADIKYYEGG